MSLFDPPEGVVLILPSHDATMTQTHEILKSQLLFTLLEKSTYLQEI